MGSGKSSEDKPKEHGEIPFLVILWKQTVVLGMRCYFLCIERAISTLTPGTFSCPLERHASALKSDNSNRLCHGIP